MSAFLNRKSRGMTAPAPLPPRPVLEDARALVKFARSRGGFYETGPRVVAELERLLAFEAAVVAARDEASLTCLAECKRDDEVEVLVDGKWSLATVLHRYAMSPDDDPTDREVNVVDVRFVRSRALLTTTSPERVRWPLPGVGA